MMDNWSIHYKWQHYILAIIMFHVKQFNPAEKKYEYKKCDNLKMNVNLHMIKISIDFFISYNIYFIKTENVNKVRYGAIIIWMFFHMQCSYCIMSIKMQFADIPKYCDIVS